MGNTSVEIRPASQGDFKFVAALMEEALSPFYSGDHRAHAKRIFSTHIEGGQDPKGHLSRSQQTFIALLNDQREVTDDEPAIVLEFKVIDVGR